MNIIKNSGIVASISMGLLLAACQSTPEPEAMAPPPPPPAQTVQQPPAPPAPPGITPGTLRDFEVNVGDRVLFDYDRSDLDESDRGTLQKQAAWLSRFPAVVLTVEGHADERGTREYNLALSARRAQSVKEYLTSLGVSASRVETISYGKERPVCVESNESCWAQNRRGVSVIKSGAVS